MIKIALIGDSIFDNGAYVPDGSEVINHLKRDIIGKGEAILLARDGAVVADVPKQLSALPDNVTHLVISIGGNDALRNIDILARPARSVAEALAAVAQVRDDFISAYRHMLDEVEKLGLPIILCTIYDVQFPDAAQRRVANLVLNVFNDGILREASARRMPVVDLRVIFNEPDDYANAIEPSGRGGAKVASVIHKITKQQVFSGFACLYRFD